MAALPPRVSVLIATYNDAPFLGAAIDSVLAQTFTDFELVVVDDASTDGSREIVERYRDRRIRLVVNAENLGAGPARNRGLATIASECVAHLDGDDVCFPQRLARQVAYLDAHPECAVVGAQATLIDIAGRNKGEVRRPVTELGIRWWRVFGSPLIHSSAMVRRAIVWDELGGYEERFRFGEDFDLWYRLAKTHAIHNLPETLVAYRFDPRSITATERGGYAARKLPKILDNMREILQWDDAPRQPVECWLELSADNARDAVDLIERCDARFTSLYGDSDEIAERTAELFVRALRKAPSFRLMLKIWRRHRKTALRTLLRAARRATV